MTQPTLPPDDGALTTPWSAVTLALIQALIPRAFARSRKRCKPKRPRWMDRYAHGDAQLEVVRWGQQRDSIYLADRKLPVLVPRACDWRAQCEIPLATYTTLQTPRSADVGLFRSVMGGLSSHEYAAAAVPEAFWLSRASVSRRFIRASVRALRRLQERRLDAAVWVARALDGKTFSAVGGVMEIRFAGSNEPTSKERNCKMRWIIDDLWSAGAYMRYRLSAVVAMTVLVPGWAAIATQAQAVGPYCRAASDTAMVALAMVKAVVASTAPRDSAFRASKGIEAAADSDVVLITDEAKCLQAIDTLNAEAVRSGGTASAEGIYLVGTGSQYAAYAPPGPDEAMGVFFMDEHFHVLATTVVP